MANDLYATLGVKRDASGKEIRAAYRRLARQFHPDVNPGDPEAERRFKEINAAHEILSDPDKRKKYDRYGDQWEHADQIEEMRRRQGAGGGGFGGGRTNFSYAGNGIDLGDLADMFARRGAPGGDGGGGVFDSIFRRTSGRQRGQDAEHAVQVTLAEAFSGTKRTLEVQEGSERCMVCGGAGQLAGATCHACRGSGVASPVRRIEVSIPAGVQDGQRVRVSGRGAAGANGGGPGDLYLRVEVTPDARFDRRGDDLYVDVDVPVVDAALGGEVHVPTLKGRSLALRVPPGTQGGKTFRLAGQGMPRQGGGFGDLFARARLRLPEPMTDEERRLFEQLREARSGAHARGASAAGASTGTAGSGA